MGVDVKKSTLLFILPLMALACEQSAHAAVSSSASLANFTITLYDLNPTDGTAPSITFSGGSRTWTEVYANDPYATNFVMADSILPFSSATSISTAGPATTTATAQSNGSTLSKFTETVNFIGNISVSGNTLGTFGNPGTAISVYYSEIGWNKIPTSQFELSAHTAVVFSAIGTADATVTTGFNTDLNAPYNGETVTASATLEVFGMGPSGTGLQNSYDSVDVFSTNTINWDPVTGKFLPNSVHSSHNLSTAFFNNTSADLQGNFQADVQVRGASMAAIPEPGTYAMLLAGLGVIGSISRRRTKR